MQNFDEKYEDESDESDESDSTRNICPSLKKLFEPDHIAISDSFSSNTSNISTLTNESSKSIEWEPPKTYGLQNSRPILQRTYIERMMNGIPIDYFEILKDDLRNIRPLTKAQMEYVKNLNTEKMIEIIEILNNATKLLIQIADLPKDD